MPTLAEAEREALAAVLQQRVREPDVMAAVMDRLGDRIADQLLEELGAERCKALFGI